MMQMHILSAVIQWIYGNINDCNPRRKRQKLIVFDAMIADIMTNKKLKAIIKELFIRCRKLIISLVFITQSYFSVPKDVRLNSTHYLIMKINNRRESQNIAINHSADIDYKDFIKIYRECARYLLTFSNKVFNKVTRIKSLWLFWCTYFSHK